MIVHRCIKIHHKRCKKWIIVMKFRVLLIMQYLSRENLVEVVLDVHARGVRIKKINSDVVTMYILQKRLMEKYLC